MTLTLALAQEVAQNADYTITAKTLISPIITFLLGLLAKFIYDLWKERRKRKYLLFTKTILNSFALDTLDEDLRQAVEVSYQGNPIKSIQLVRMELENPSTAAVKKQAVTVRFAANAQIITEPKHIGSSEDFRFVRTDAAVTDRNARRFVIDLLQKGRTLAWEFVVINHGDLDFTVEHGVESAESKESDLDVSATFATDRAQLNLAGRIRRIVRLLVYLQIAYVLKTFLPTHLFGAIFELAVPVVNIGIVWILLLLMREIGLTIEPVLGWFQNSGGSHEQVSISADYSNVVVAPHGNATLRGVADEGFIKALKEVVKPDSASPVTVSVPPSEPPPEVKP